MPPCGNFGLVYIAADDVPVKSNSKNEKPNYIKENSIHCENVEAVENGNNGGGLLSHDPISVLPSLNILRGQAAWTEFRGGYDMFIVLLFNTK